MIFKKLACETSRLSALLLSTLCSLAIFLCSLGVHPRDDIAVSVIIPIHNVEKFIGQCIGSILNQSLRNIEVICVNDKSTDKSFEVVKGFAKLDDRVVLIENPKNLGPGVSRNSALNIARGEYVSFIDSDDWINPDFLKKLYDSAKAYNTDFSFCQITNFDHFRQKIFTRGEFSTRLPEEFEHRSFSWKDTIKDIFAIPLNPVNKIYRRDFLIKNSIRFSPAYFLEDHAFSLKSTLFAKSISYIPDRLYVYRVNHKESLSHSRNFRLLNCFAEYKKMERVALSSKSDEFIRQTLEYITQSAVMRNMGVKDSWHSDYVKIAKKFFRTSRLLALSDYSKLSNYTTNFLHKLFMHMNEDGEKVDPEHFKMHHMHS